MSNIDQLTVAGFGYEWKKYDQRSADYKESKRLFEQYFSIFPWNEINSTSVGADLGCGSGRWAKFVAPRVGILHLIDASAQALAVAKRNVGNLANVCFHHGSIEEIQLKEDSLDFAFSLGVLHHLPDTKKALKDISSRLKPNAPFLLYIYYDFDNRPSWYRSLWKVTDLIRCAIARLPQRLRLLATEAIAFSVYWPMAKLAKMLDAMSLMPTSWPLAYYRDRSLYVMRNDALDRFGTRLEKRYSKNEIKQMLLESGFCRVTFSDHAPYWCALAYKGSPNVG